MSKFVKVGDFDWKELQDGRYYNAFGKRTPFSMNHLMVVKKLKNGMVNPVSEQYISEISAICLEPIDVQWEVEE